MSDVDPEAERSEASERSSGEAESREAERSEASERGSASERDASREAERERLREKYEKERAEREVTQQMSELLLRGATMTNKHCETCSNPIFRYEGEEFCPVCSGQVEDPQGDATGGGADADATGADAAGTTTVQGDADAAEEAADDSPQSPDAGTASAVATAAGAGGRDRTETPPTPGTADAGGASGGTADAPADLTEARDSLVRTLTDCARQAEAAGDVRRRRDLLAAAREAAEALAALDRASR